jgi:membrane protease YdiL (CAAX protease family)
VADGASPQGRSYFGLRPYEWSLIGVSLALNPALHHVLPRRFQTPASLVTSAVMSGVAMKLGVGAEKQGLSPSTARRGAVYGILAAMPVVAAVACAPRITKLSRFYRSSRVEEASRARAAFEILVRIPFGTALPEEVIFRGALPGVLSLRHSRRLVVALSSLVFGLSHIASSERRVAVSNAEEARVHPGLVAGHVVFTAMAGLCLSWLRRRSGSVVAPWIAHAAANAAGYAGVWFAARRVGQDRSGPVVVNDDGFASPDSRVFGSASTS